MKKIFLLLSIFLFSCAGTVCVSETDKHIKGQRHHYNVYNGKCPTHGKFNKWLFIIPAGRR